MSETTPRPFPFGAHGPMPRPLAWILILAIVLCTAGACTPDPGKLIGDTIIQLETTVEGIIQQASVEGNGIVLTAGTEVQNALDTAKSNLAELMDKGYNQVNTTVQNTLNQVQAMVDDLNSKATAQLHKATLAAQQILNALPLTNKNPQVTSYTPAYLSVGTIVGDTVAIDIQGNFVHAFEQHMTPTMSYAGAPTPLPAQTLLTQELTFYPPAALFRDNAGTGILPRLDFTLNIPYETGTIFKTLHPGEFRLTVTLLPAPVKSLTLNNVELSTANPTKPPLEQVTKVFPNPAEHVYSYDCKDKNVTLGPYLPDQPNPTERWQIDPGSVGLITSFPRGDQRKQITFLEKTGNGVTVRVETFSNCNFLGISNKSGDVYVQVYYTEYFQPPTPPPTTQEKPTHEDLLKTGPLTWGGDIVRGVTENRWSVDVTLFDGTQKTYDATDYSNPYFRVTYNQGSHTVKIDAVATDSVMAKP